MSAVARSSRLAVWIGKEAFCSQMEPDEPGASKPTKAVMAINARSDDVHDGTCAFLDEREPRRRDR